jgi:methyl-accepting chemotaxis protein
MLPTATVAQGSSRMKNLKVGTRIYAGFAIMLLIIMSIGAMCLVVVNYFDGQQGLLVKEARNVSGIQEIERDIAALRGQIFIYITTGTADDLKTANTLITGIKEKFDGLAGTLTDQDFRAALTELQGQLSRYVDEFKKSVDYRERRDWLVDTGTDSNADAVVFGLAPVVKDALAGGEFELAAWLGQAQQEIWAARTANANFEVSGASTDAAQIKPHMARFHQAMATALALPEAQPIQPKLARIAKFGLDYDLGFATLTPIVMDYKMLATTTLPALAGNFIKASSDLSSRMRQSLKDIQDNVDHAVQTMMALVIGASLLSLVLGGLIAWVIARGIIRPVVGMTTTMTLLADGDLTVPVPALENRDEVGDMARAVEVFRDHALENEMLKAVQLGEQRTKERRQKEAEELIDMFGSSVSGVFSSLSVASTDMANTAQSMRTVVSETNRQIDIVMKAVADAGLNADAVAAASEELSASINEISRLVNDSARIAEEGANQAREVVQRVSLLRNASEKIGNIIGIISNIATQTNLLALNATIEAARAGEAGRGFVVVANEVKTLSGQTQRATVDITAQIQGIQSSISNTVSAVGSIGKTIDHIYRSSSEIAAAITQQQSATEGIARNIHFVATGAEQISTSMTAVRASADQTSEASLQVNHASSSMANQSEKLSVEVKDFLLAIKEAGTKNEFERLEINIGATVTVDGRAQQTRARQISVGGAWLDAVIDRPLGSQVAVTLDGFAQPIRARIAGLADKGTRLQFPMDSSHLALMARTIERLTAQQS